MPAPEDRLPPDPDPDRPARAPVCVLVVDDVEDNLLMTQALLERPGLAVLTAGSAEGALALLRDNEVALALLDVQMPRTSGFALAEAMRGSPATRDVPIMFVTGATVDAARTFRGYEAGAVDFLFKPVEPRVLESKVAVFVELYQQRRELRERNAELERLLRINEMMAEELREAHGKALHEALTDELTGVPNRRHILQVGENGLADKRKQAQPLSVVVIDLDHFKLINDRHGHGVGDAVLRHFCDHCRACLRPKHALGRLGGEEFLLLMPGTAVDDALVAVERVRRTLPPCDGVSYTFSAGLAQAGGQSLSAVLARADTAMYRAKRLGRNRSEVDAG